MREPLQQRMQGYAFIDGFGADQRAIGIDLGQRIFLLLRCAEQ